MPSAKLGVSAGAGAEVAGCDWPTSKGEQQQQQQHMSAPTGGVRDAIAKTSAEDGERSASRSASPPFAPSFSWKRHRPSLSDSSSISSRLSLATGSMTSCSPPPSSSLSPTYTDSSYANPWAASRPGVAVGRVSTVSPLASPITLMSIGDEPSSVQVEACGDLGAPPSSREHLVFPYRMKHKNRESWDSALGSDMNGRRTRGSSLAGLDFQPFPGAHPSLNKMLPPLPPFQIKRASTSSASGSAVHIEADSPAHGPPRALDNGRCLPAAPPSLEECDETSSDTTMPAEDAAGRILNYTLDVAFGLGADSVDASVCRSIVNNFMSDLGWAIDQAREREEADDLPDPGSSSPCDGGGQPPARNSSSSSNNTGREGKRRSGGGGGRGKRKSQELSDDEQQDGDDSNDDGDARQSEPGPSKRAKPNPGVRMSCPYRKKNPLRFNVRDHRLCALTVFTDTAELRRHIQDCHKRPPNSPYRCLRCRVRFDSEKGLEEHLNSLDIALCVKRPPTEGGDVYHPEDGIDNAIAEKLRSKKGRVSDSIEVQWQKIWCLLFPDTEVQPYDYCAVMEHHELKEKYLGAMPALNRSLSVIGLGERGVETLERILTNHFIDLFERCNEEGRSKDYRNRQPRAAPAQQQTAAAAAAAAAAAVPDSQLRKQSSLRKRLAAAQRDSGFVEDDQSVVGGLQDAGIGGGSSSEEGGGGAIFTPPAFASDNGSSPGLAFRMLHHRNQQQSSRLGLPLAGDDGGGVRAGFPPAVDGHMCAATAADFHASIGRLEASMLTQSEGATWVMPDSFGGYGHAINGMATVDYTHSEQLGHGGFGFPIHQGDAHHLVSNAIPMSFADTQEIPDPLQDSTSAWVYSQQP